MGKLPAGDTLFDKARFSYSRLNFSTIQKKKNIFFLFKGYPQERPVKRIAKTNEKKNN